MAFAHLHLHTEYSLLDGACRIDRLMDRLKALGQTSVVITDHGNMYGVIDFYKAAKAKGIHPVIGCEVYVAPRTRFDKVHGLDNENYHLVLLCENNKGYENLMQLVSRAWIEGFYNRPRVDEELLREYHEGLIALSACLAGKVSRDLTARDYRAARETALKYLDIFGENNYFLELQDHGLREQKEINPELIRLSHETGIPLVLTNDCHYLEKEDHKMHHVLVCIQTNHTVQDEDVLSFGTNEFYVKSEEEMRALFPQLPEAADRTEEIARRCQVEIEFGKTKLPYFEAPGGEDTTAYFRRLCMEGLVRRYGENYDPAVRKRLEYELGVIETMGYVNYFLIVYDFIRYAKSVHIPVGHGRGSGVGSVAAYCIGITNVDPIRYGLIFERFLNTERVSMPDFDIDFSDERRQEIIDYVVRKYGEDHVAQIVTFGTMAARAAIRDVGRAMAMPYAAVDSVAKLVPSELNITLDRALEQSAELKHRYDTDAQVRELIDMSRKIEGMPRHASTHAAGVVITDKPVSCYVPLAKNDDVVVTQYTMTTIEKLGLLKMDFLGLRNLSVIDHAEQMIRRSVPGFSVESISEEDPAVFEMIGKGYTEGVFQFESPGMKRVIMQLQPTSIEDLIAVISLYRPGPMRFIPTYIENRRHPEKITYLHPRLSGILDVTYGCIVYQEQVMQIFRELAGYPLGRADLVRRAMGKKQHDVMEQERQIFLYGKPQDESGPAIEGCLARGVSKEVAEKIFADMEDFASYAFNKSHAAAYAKLSYQTAYLKCHYPREYMSALISSVLGMSNKVAAYMEECNRLHIKVLPPHVNVSESGFVVKDGDIRFGLLAVRNVGRTLIDRIVQERQANGPYTSLYNFCERLQGRDLNRRALESLVKCGALDHLGYNRREMLNGIPQILESLDADARKNLEGQIGFFDLAGSAKNDEPVLEKLEEFSLVDRLAMEKETVGMYITGNPMETYRAVYKSPAIAMIGAIMRSKEEGEGPYRDNQRVTLFGMIGRLKRRTSKNNAAMAVVTLEDISGAMEVLVFPQVYAACQTVLAEGKILRMSGRLSFMEEQEPKLICDSVAGIPTDEELKHIKPPRQAENTRPKQSEVPHKKASSPEKAGLYLKFASEDSKAFRKAMQYLAIFDGQTQVFLYFADRNILRRVAANERVALNDVLLRELRKLLGNENVAVLE